MLLSGFQVGNVSLFKNANGNDLSGISVIVDSRLVITQKDWEFSKADLVDMGQASIVS